MTTDQSVEKVVDLLKPENFVKISMMKKLSFKQPKRVCSIVQSDTVKMSGNGNTLFTFDILKDVLELADSFVYVSFVGLVISGEWLVPKNTPGSAEVFIVDNRLKGRFSVLSKFQCDASVQSFQFKTAPNYSLTVEDAKKGPFELFATVKDLPFKDGFNPLSVEVACLVQFSNCVIDRSLTVKFNSKFSQAEVTVEQVNDLLGELPALKLIDKLRHSNRIKPEIQARVVSEPKGNTVKPKKANLKPKGVTRVRLDNVSTSGDTEFENYPKSPSVSEFESDGL